MRTEQNLVSSSKFETFLSALNRYLFFVRKNVVVIPFVLFGDF
jgi:hypothetical protein